MDILNMTTRRQHTRLHDFFSNLQVFAIYFRFGSNIACNHMIRNCCSLYLFLDLDLIGLKGTKI